MQWYEISIRTTTGAVEAVANLFDELGAKGVVIEDAHDFNLQKKNEYDWDFIEEDIFAKYGEGASVIGYLADEHISVGKVIEDIQKKLRDMESYGLDIGEGKVQWNVVDDSEWKDSWKQYYKPIHIGEKLVIKPSWEAYEAKENQLVIELDPGMAFGTGTHETTRMCLESIEKYINPDNDVLDIGTGSGILSIGAALLGASHVEAIDIDPVAVDVAKENIKEQQLQEKVRVSIDQVTDFRNESFDIIVMNIIAQVIIDQLETVQKKMKGTGCLILSGIIQSKKDLVLSHLDQNALSLIEERSEGEWVCLVAQKKGR